ncbi:hypothetical protein HID58_071068 [Brassica napus]|uniref:Multifunctional fusion protein n=4 Tax=Brassica TaxID=3705 RepID=A0ABQ7Z0J3_BRANA|nr:hypothetical protein HID58_071068 [Brassica napus]CDY13363.1 BnaC06g13940D [Brassica napus]VDD61779.1 unnamed protein product [Brassica oleracea]
MVPSDPVIRGNNFLWLHLCYRLTIFSNSQSECSEAEEATCKSRSTKKMGIQRCRGRMMSSVRERSGKRRIESLTSLAKRRDICLKSLKNGKGSSQLTLKEVQDEGQEVRYEDGYMRGSDARIEWERREDFCFCLFEGIMRGPKDVRCITTRGGREGPSGFNARRREGCVFLTLSPTLNEAACYNLGSVALGSLIIFFVESVRFILEAIHRRTKLSGTTPDHWFSRMGHYTSRLSQKLQGVNINFAVQGVNNGFDVQGLKPKEISGINSYFSEPGTLSQMGCSSVAQKYMVIEGEPNAFIRMKKGAGGVTIKKTTQALVFFMTTNDLDQCNIVVERFGDYLIDTWL